MRDGRRIIHPSRAGRTAIKWRPNTKSIGKRVSALQNCSTTDTRNLGDKQFSNISFRDAANVFMVSLTGNGSFSGRLRDPAGATRPPLPLHPRRHLGPVEVSAFADVEVVRWFLTLLALAFGFTCLAILKWHVQRLPFLRQAILSHRGLQKRLERAPRRGELLAFVDVDRPSCVALQAWKLKRRDGLGRLAPRAANVTSRPCVTAPPVQ